MRGAHFKVRKRGAFDGARCAYAFRMRVARGSAHTPRACCLRNGRNKRDLVPVFALFRASPDQLILPQLEVFQPLPPKRWAAAARKSTPICAHVHAGVQVGLGVFFFFFFFFLLLPPPLLLLLLLLSPHLLDVDVVVAAAAAAPD